MDVVNLIVLHFCFMQLSLLGCLLTSLSLLLSLPLIRSLSLTPLTSRGFFPVIVGFIRRIPVLGSILNLPFISAVRITRHCCPPAALPCLHAAWLFLFIIYPVQTMRLLKNEKMPPRSNDSLAPTAGLMKRYCELVWIGYPLEGGLKIGGNVSRMSISELLFLMRGVL